MQLKLSTDYAIRIVLYIAMKNRKVSGDELGEKLNISKQHVYNFCKRLSDEKIVHIHNYTKDEFSLAKHPSEITMFDIIKAMENTIKINLCLEEDEYCSRSATKVCPIRRFYCELQNKIEEELIKKTIQDLL
ncbi:RrF2 family transcriptional regulator [Clostridium tertium]|uniref:RrF2 family transcriptional regulator n=1 Tax=Clostridium tertium TaxID=1559 RepID=UPI00374E47BE